MMIILTLPKVIYRPHLYYMLVFLISGSSWFLAIYFSYQVDRQLITLLLAGLGLFGPMIAAIIMALYFGNDALRKDYRCYRSVPAAILFHFLLVATAEILQTEPQTKWIITALLLIVCSVIIKIEYPLINKKINTLI